MLNFTVGPVMSSADILEISSHSTPYFRTPEFSRIMLENERLMLKYLNAPKNSRCVFLTTSGTGAMESCVINILNKQDKIIVVNGGSFGQRFVELCELHDLQYDELKCKFGSQITKEQLDIFSGKGYTALLINMHETSSGVLYDMDIVSSFCRANGILLIVDAISSFLSDELDMQKLGIAAALTGSQKALAVQPGVSVIALAPEALKRVEDNREICLYLSLKQALENMERGQTPFTPAVTILMQINKRLKQIDLNGGVVEERKRIANLANYFRKRIVDYPFKFVNDCSSNTVTALYTKEYDAERIVSILKDEYNIWVCPNGGKLSKQMFRVGHIGNLTTKDYDKLFDALDAMIEKKKI